MSTEPNKDDIVERLIGVTDKYPGFRNLNTEAAATITTLRSQVADLTAQRTAHFEDINAALTRAGVNLCEIDTYGGAIDSLTVQRDAMQRRWSLESGGVLSIAIERERQVSHEGWTSAHDDEHTDGALACAAACYAMPAERREMDGHTCNGTYAGSTSDADAVPRGWLWLRSWWKPTPNDRRHELVKAGALIAAEIDRLDRAALALCQPSPGTPKE